MTLETRLYTIDDVVAAARHLLKWELVEGRIVPMSVPGRHHLLTVNFLVDMLKAFVNPRGIGWVFGGPGLVTRFQPDSLRSPAVCFMSNERFEQYTGNYMTVLPELAIEVRSPNNSWPDLHRQALEYLAAGVERVWNIDTRRKQVRVYTSATACTDLGEDDAIVGDGLLDGLVIPMRDIIASARH